MNHSQKPKSPGLNPSRLTLNSKIKFEIEFEIEFENQVRKSSPKIKFEIKFENQRVFCWKVRSVKTRFEQFCEKLENFQGQFPWENSPSS